MFEGFSPETFDFLWGIRLNNEKTWFEAHKADYIRHLYEPMKALGQEVFSAFSHVPAMELHVSRIYRDARMHPPFPYKESLWFSIRYRVEEWSRHPTLYFDIRPEGASYGFSLWRPTPAVMEEFRRDLLSRPSHFPQLLQQAQAESGLPFTAECYKRPKPCDNAALAPYFGWKGDLSAGAFLAPGENLFTPELVERLQSALLPWVPLCEYFYTFTQD